MTRQFADTIVVLETFVDIAKKVITDIPETSKAPILLSDFAKRVCKENKQAKAYTGVSSYNTQTNWKWCHILHSLLAESSKVKQVHSHPIAPQWFDATDTTYEDENQKCIIAAEQFGDAREDCEVHFF